MSFMTNMNEKIKTLGWKDISLIKLSVAAIVLMIAKLWEGLLGLEWYWYGIIFVLVIIMPLKKMYMK